MSTRTQSVKTDEKTSDMTEARQDKTARDHSGSNNRELSQEDIVQTLNLSVLVADFRAFARQRHAISKSKVMADAFIRSHIRIQIDEEEHADVDINLDGGFLNVIKLRGDRRVSFFHETLDTSCVKFTNSTPEVTQPVPLEVNASCVKFTNSTPEVTQPVPLEVNGAFCVEFGTTKKVMADDVVTTVKVFLATQEDADELAEKVREGREALVSSDED